MQIYFVRHGESEANILHEVSNRGFRHPLTEKGREQARTLAASLRDVPVSKIYSSPLMRAVQVAEILAEKFKVPYETTDALREYDCGIIEGQADDASWAMWSQLRHDWLVDQKWDSRIEGGESFYDVQNRFVPFVEGLLNADTNGVIVLVAHGGLFTCMLPLVLKNVSFEFAQSVGVTYTGAVIAETRTDGLYCLTWCGGMKGVRP
ncbi:MAG TPA: histidine phosphatase family protein [Aggregatilineaceae bacterium]|nr:histidine phosphatase family protein [Aggregatilineaceae bacterium]